MGTWSLLQLNAHAETESKYQYIDPYGDAYAQKKKKKTPTRSSKKLASRDRTNRPWSVQSY